MTTAMESLKFLCRKGVTSGEGIIIKSQLKASGFVDSLGYRLALIKFFHGATTSKQSIYAAFASTSGILYNSARGTSSTIVSATVVCTSGTTGYLVDCRASRARRYIRVKVCSSNTHVQGVEIVLGNAESFPVSNLGLRALTNA